MDLLSWRDFLDPDLQSVVERAALRRRDMTVSPPELFEALCEDTLWQLCPSIAMQLACAQLEEARALGL
jgi:hypothetical protein